MITAYGNCSTGSVKNRIQISGFFRWTLYVLFNFINGNSHKPYPLCVSDPYYYQYSGIYFLVWTKRRFLVSLQVHHRPSFGALSKHGSVLCAGEQKFTFRRGLKSWLQHRAECNRNFRSVIDIVKLGSKLRNFCFLHWLVFALCWRQK